MISALVLCLAGISVVRGQANVRDSSISMVLIAPSYGFQTPGGDMAKRFGNNSAIGVYITVKRKSHWMYSFEANYIFGGRLNQTGIFDGITTSQGVVIGSDGYTGDIRIYERGYYGTFSIGRLFPVRKPNPNCGFFLQAGVGFMQHKIRIEDKKNSVPALDGAYKKGYDHLTNGMCLREFAGYLYTGNHRLINFFGGMEMVQGFTKNRRDYNFNTGQPETKNRLDLLFGLRVGWIMPLYKQSPDKYYIY